MKLLLDRKEYSGDRTLGDLYLNGSFECVTLEDELQPTGKKIIGATCIPDGTYSVIVTWSPKFKRDLPLLLDVPGFDGIRIHPGNSPEDTTGCLLVGTNYTKVMGKVFLLHSIQAFDRLFSKMFYAKRDGEAITLEIAP